ncbi:hypothetical protein QUS99_22520, partial [Xanthomonas citri pv. citri]
MLAAIQPMNDLRFASAKNPIRIESPTHAIATGGIVIEIANMPHPQLGPFSILTQNSTDATTGHSLQVDGRPWLPLV